VREFGTSQRALFRPGLLDSKDDEAERYLTALERALRWMLWRVQAVHLAMERNRGLLAVIAVHWGFIEVESIRW
jgi:hypothetical protein